ncbi:lysophospholipid acyltransferase family protein [Streptomyces sp. ISL-94]|uniref:lysophospholipid acyltransferase family protein n=1 Tax=Streptomyces sp. ISL-94 TaxID=2819190 RepID=UPI001BEC2100|nr:lysophospholipid acyltransferase family protein [Streptomyces sp. ISL-94]MBT2478944.1 1-acyl-sn-glycerol-3-phosphate acyltransferase [Streptomyces sp. ISL-94]
MLSRIAAAVVPACGRLRVTADPGARPAAGGIFAANHTSLADPAVVVAALRRYGIEPVILATSGLWRVPLLGPALRREGHIAVHRGTRRAADSLDAAAVALASGRSVLLYGEGRLPGRRDAGESAPGPFRSGLARLAAATGAPVVPVGQAGARRLCSGSRAKQLAGAATAPLRRPGLHVHIGAPLRLPDGLAEATDRAREAVTDAWRTAALALGEPVPAGQRRCSVCNASTSTLGLCCPL